MTIGVKIIIFSALAAQEDRGAISGSVTDQQGAAVAKSKIVATEIQTGVKSETISEVSGASTIPFLLPGEYPNVVECPGFKTAIAPLIESFNTNEPCDHGRAESDADDIRFRIDHGPGEHGPPHPDRCPVSMVILRRHHV